MILFLKTINSIVRYDICQKKVCVHTLGTKNEDLCERVFSMGEIMCVWMWWTHFVSHIFTRQRARRLYLEMMCDAMTKLSNLCERERGYNNRKSLDMRDTHPERPTRAMTNNARSDIEQQNSEIYRAMYRCWRWMPYHISKLTTCECDTAFQGNVPL